MYSFTVKLERFDTVQLVWTDFVTQCRLSERVTGAVGSTSDTRCAQFIVDCFCVGNSAASSTGCTRLYESSNLGNARGCVSPVCGPVFGAKNLGSNSTGKKITELK